MTALSPEDKREWMRWTTCGLVVVLAHAGAAAVFASRGDPVPPGEPVTAITIELAPIAAAPTMEKTDLPIAPLQQQSEPERQPDTPEQEEKEPEKKIEEPPPPPAAVALPEPEKPKPQPKPKPKKQAVATAPEAAERIERNAVAPVPGAGRSNPNAMASWKGLISATLQRHKNYPSGSRSRREEGTAMLRFTLNRQGQVVSSGIAHSSGHSELDQETLAVVRRAQPFPPPPADVAGSQFPFTVPMRYYLR